jgi:ABC-2 type transport system ATP-binding protein
MMMNIYIPDSGEVILRGTKIGQEFKDKVGYLPEERGLYKKMKVMDTLLFLAELKGKTGKVIEKNAINYLKRFDLVERKNSKLEDLSKGNQQKIQFIAAILHDPEFLIFDEPFSGLDPINTDLLKDIILEKKEEGKVIIFSTHLMDFAEKLSDHIAMIDHGKIILEGSLSEIKSKFAQKNITLEAEGDLSFLERAAFVEKVENFGNSIGIKVKETSQTQDLLKLLVQNDVKVNKFAANEISLHEIFVTLAGKDSNNVK